VDCSIVVVEIAWLYVLWAAEVAVKVVKYVTGGVTADGKVETAQKATPVVGSKEPVLGPPVVPSAGSCAVSTVES